jgi:hypothetical protein
MGGGEPTVTQPDPGGGTGSLPPVSSTNGNGPFTATMETVGGNNVLFRPTTLGQGGVKHPIFVWGTGAGAAPSRYRDHFTQMASHGIVVISPNKTMKTGTDMRNTLNWILQAANTTYAGKLDTANIAMGGHSQGSTSTFDAEATLNNLKTTIHIAGGSFDGRGSSKVKTPTMYMCGSTDIALTNCQRDFQNMRAGGPPTFFSVMQGVDHIQAARRANPAMIAWLRWHLAGETQWKAKFSPGGEYFTGIFRSQVKNWN